MINQTLSKLIEEMKEVKQEHTTLSVAEVLKIFEIKAMRDLTKQLRSFK